MLGLERQDGTAQLRPDPLLETGGEAEGGRDDDQGQQG